MDGPVAELPLVVFPLATVLPHRFNEWRAARLVDPGTVEHQPTRADPVIDAQVRHDVELPAEGFGGFVAGFSGRHASGPRRTPARGNGRRACRRTAAPS